MDFSCIYELRNRLRASMIAGSLLFEEDFRSKKAIEAVRPLAGAAPVFGKIVDQCDKLLASEGSERALVLADTITLVDAVICTLQNVAVKEEAEEIKADDSGNRILELSFIERREAVTALTEKGSGRWSAICFLHQNKPEIFRDFRVFPAFVKALGAAYNETGTLIADIMIKEMDDSILPVLKKDFDPKGGREMENRLWVIMNKEGAAANEFYLSILPDAKKGVRCRVIEALRYSEENRELLKSLHQTEKKEAAEMALESLKYLTDSGIHNNRV